MKKQSGMTLIEVLISLAILTFLSISTGRFIRNSLQDKAKKTKDAEGQSQVRDALNVIKRDINLAFHSHDINVYVYNRAHTIKQNLQDNENTDKTKAPANPSGDPPGSSAPTTPEDYAKNPPQTEFIPKKELTLTHFIGTDNSVHFTTRSNQPRRPNEKFSDIIEVGYYIESCHPKGYPQAKSSKCLWRRQSGIIDDDVTEGGSATVLVENVTEFNLSYKGPERETEWIKEWKTKDTINDYQKNKFPFMVRVDLKTNFKDKDYDLILTTAINNPSNIQERLKTELNKTEPAAPETGGSGGGGDATKP